jgi:hypothetical protein
VPQNSLCEKKLLKRIADYDRKRLVLFFKRHVTCYKIFQRLLSVLERDIAMALLKAKLMLFIERVESIKSEDLKGINCVL